MGSIKATDNANGGQLLEITYGGVEAPFGGIDTSAPPAYIDPKCFANSDGVLVVDNKIVLASLMKVQNPTFFGNVFGVSLIGCGTFYNSIFKQLNYALGYTATPFGDPGVTPTGVTYKFYITSWDPSNSASVNNDTLSLSLYDSSLSAVQASISLPALFSGFVNQGGGTGATGTITVSGGTLLSFTPTGGSSGTGYTVGEIVEIIQGTNGTGAIMVSSVGGGGAITAATINTLGTAYTAGAVTTGETVDQSNVGVTINGPAGGPHTYTVFSNKYFNNTPGTLVAALVTAINAAPDPNVTASASPDGLNLVLAANLAVLGSAGNSITVVDASANTITTFAPPFYFSPKTATNLQGGLDLVNEPAPRSFGLASTAEVGGTLFIGNIGPMILQFSGPGTFQINTMYTGVQVLRKFAGSLVGLGVIPSLGSLIQNPDMVFVWSAATELGEWAPVTTAGNVTGAGFTQLADIGDFLVGLIVSNNTAFILRSQGVSYATPLNNGTDPYDFANIGLGDSGEGAQVSALVAQYDQMGLYVANTNIYAVVGQPQQVGEKIKNPIFQFLEALPDPLPTAFNAIAPYLMSAGACGVFIGGTEAVLFAFLLGQTLYIYNASNGSWTKHTYSLPGGTLELVAGIMSTLSNSSLATSGGGFRQGLLSIAEGLYDTNITSLTHPQIWSLVEGIAPESNTISGPQRVIFPVEEVAFGREITIDAIFIAVQALIPSGAVSLTFIISGQTFSTIDLDTSFTDVDANPMMLQVFPQAETFVAANPQLEIQISSSSTGLPLVRICKVCMFASFDPNQRPV